MVVVIRYGERGGGRPYQVVTRVKKEMVVRYYVKFYIYGRRMAVRRWLGSTAATALQPCLAHSILAVAGKELAPQSFHILYYLYGDSKVILSICSTFLPHLLEDLIQLRTPFCLTFYDTTNKDLRDLILTT